MPHIFDITRRPLVSVALGTYNGSRFLREQLDSIYAQSWPNIEVVACDDCSTDDTVSILEEYRQSHGLRYEVNERNIGFLRNFEKAISLCSGDFIALADQDDVWLIEKLERLVSGIGNASLVYTDASLINAYGQEIRGSLITTSGVRPVSGNEFAYFVCNSCVTGCTVLFRRELLHVALPIPSCEIYHDWWLAVVASRMDGVAYLEARLTKYRQHGANDTGANVKTGILSRIAAQFSAETREVKRRYFELLRNRADMYREIGQRLRLTEDDLRFLSDIRRYASSLLGEESVLTSFALALRYRGILYPAASSLEKTVYILSTLIR